MPPVEFAPWQTSIQNDELYLTDLAFGNGSWWQDRPTDEVSFDIPAARTVPDRGLLATFFSFQKSALFTVHSSDTVTFRILDEHGLMELWHATDISGGRPARSTFRVRNHGWYLKSELSFFASSADYSYMIATGAACLEIVVRAPPTIEFLRAVPPSPLNRHRPEE